MDDAVENEHARYGTSGDAIINNTWIIPIYYDVPDLPLGQRMSWFFVSVKLTNRSSRSKLNFIAQDDAKISYSTLYCPWIAILLDYV